MSWWSRTRAATAGEFLSVRKNHEFSSHGAPHTSNARHQVAKASRSGPAARLNSAKAVSRSSERGAEKISHSACRLASHEALMSIGSALSLAAATEACSSSTCARVASSSAAYSGMSCGRI